MLSQLQRSWDTDAIGPVKTANGVDAVDGVGEGRGALVLVPLTVVTHRPRVDKRSLLRHSKSMRI